MPKIIDVDKQVSEILTESIDILSECGFAQLNMRLLAKRLDISTGTLYHYFANKEDFYLKLLEFTVQKDLLQLETLLAQNLSTSNSLELIFEDIQQNQSHYSKQIKIWSDFLLQLSFCSQQDRGLALVEKHSQSEEQCIQLLCQIFRTTQMSEVRFFWLSLEAILADHSVTLDAARFTEMLGVLKRYCLLQFSQIPTPTTNEEI